MQQQMVSALCVVSIRRDMPFLPPTGWRSWPGIVVVLAGKSDLWEIVRLATPYPRHTELPGAEQPI